MADTSAFAPAAGAGTGARGAGHTLSHIDRESSFIGSYRTPHDLRIDGRYEGEIACEGTVHVGETAQVNARIAAGNVVVAGRCEGEIVCDKRLELLATARVSGTVRAATVIVHEGAFYEGELKMSGASAPASGRPPAATGAGSSSPSMRPSALATGDGSGGRPPAASGDRPLPPPRRRAGEPSAPTDGPDPNLTSAGATPRANGAINGRPLPPRADPSPSM